MSRHTAAAPEAVSPPAPSQRAPAEPRAHEETLSVLRALRWELEVGDCV